MEHAKLDRPQSAVPTLAGTLVTLRPIEAGDAAALVTAAADGDLWKLRWTVVPCAASVDDYIATALRGWRQGSALPFVVTLSASGQVIGSTRLWNIEREHRKAEIGHTWYARSWQRTAVNTECKLMLLRYAFEQLRCVRVQLTTDVLNEASRAAILRLGAVEEGIIRNERIMPDGRKRSSVRYSIVDDEWPAVRSRLRSRLRQHLG